MKYLFRVAIFVAFAFSLVLESSLHAAECLLFMRAVQRIFGTKDTARVQEAIQVARSNIPDGYYWGTDQLGIERLVTISSDSRTFQIRAEKIHSSDLGESWRNTVVNFSLESHGPSPSKIFKSSRNNSFFRFVAKQSKQWRQSLTVAAEGDYLSYLSLGDNFNYVSFNHALPTVKFGRAVDLSQNLRDLYRAVAKRELEKNSQISTALPELSPPSKEMYFIFEGRAPEVFSSKEHITGVKIADETTQIQYGGKLYNVIRVNYNSVGALLLRDLIDLMPGFVSASPTLPRFIPDPSKVQNSLPLRSTGSSNADIYLNPDLLPDEVVAIEKRFEELGIGLKNVKVGGPFQAFQLPRHRFLSGNTSVGIPYKDLLEATLIPGIYKIEIIFHDRSGGAEE